MTDKERFIQLMADFGVPLHTWNTEKDDLTIEGEFNETYTGKISGYTNASFLFDNDGKFKQVRLYE